MVCVGGQELKVRLQRDQKKDIHIFLSNLKQHLFDPLKDRRKAASWDWGSWHRISSDPFSAILWDRYKVQTDSSLPCSLSELATHELGLVLNSSVLSLKQCLWKSLHRSICFFHKQVQKMECTRSFFNHEQSYVCWSCEGNTSQVWTWDTNLVDFVPHVDFVIGFLCMVFG